MPAKIMLIKMKNTRFTYKAVLLLLVAALLTGIVIYNLKSVSHQFQPPVPQAAQQVKVSVEPAAPVTVAEPPVASPAPPPAAKILDDSICWPLAGDVVQEFGWQLNPVLKDWRYHIGIDISAANGKKVKAMLSGKVESVYNDEKTGLTVMVRSGNRTTYYGSLAEASVNPNDIVESGAIIGKTGICPGEPYPHLHLAVKTGEQYIDARKIAK